MKRLIPSVLCAAGLLASRFAAGQPAGTAPVWSDEFNQPVGSSPDPAKWTYDLGGNGWGNHELEQYVSDAANCAVVSDAAASDGRALAIRALRTATGYTSARIKTRGRRSFTYGHFEARLRIPVGQGIWPAFWLLGDRVSTVGWPAVGEIDVMENIGSRPDQVYGTLHGPGYSGEHGIQGKSVLPRGKAYASAYHVFALDWAPGRLTWSVDGRAYQTLTPASLPTGTAWVYDDAPFFVILNLAIGGGWPGVPDATTQFPQTLYVDYVRVYAAATPKTQ